MASAEDNIARQADEVEAMSSIYGDEWCAVDEVERSFCIGVGDGKDPPRLSVSLQVTLPADYPGQAPPSYQLNGPWLTREDKRSLSASLEEIYSQNLGESVLFLWVERIREFLADASERSQPAWNTYRANQTEEESDLVYEMLPTILGEGNLRSRDLGASDDFTEDEMPPIMHGETITDRRSTFQAHVAPVVTTKQVKQVLRKLLENKKIASATHNIMAYRIDCPGKNAFLQDCDDDGETAAGGRLLHLLQILDVRDAVVVVSRWYGGIMLGPDRFKHINNCARSVLVTNGFAPTAGDVAKDTAKPKKRTAKKGKQ